MNKKDELVSITELKPWDENPRGITKDAMDRLRKSVRERGQYKPLLVNEDYVVLGGNMRLEAYKLEGITEVWVSVVSAKDRKTMVEYALSDNDRAGYYEDDKLAELVISLPGLNLSEYSVDLGQLTPLDELVGFYQPKEIELNLPEGDKGSFKQITFTFHESQEVLVRDAIDTAVLSGNVDFSLNENKSASAMAHICEGFVNEYKRSNS